MCRVAVSLPHRTSTIEPLSPNHLPLHACSFSSSHLSFPLCLSFLSLSGSTHFAGGIKCDVGIYVDENHIVYTNRARVHVCTRVRPPCGVLGPRGRTAVPATLSRPRPLHMPLHTHIMDRPSVPLSPIAALSSGSLARSPRFPRSCRCSIHERNECRETIHRSCRSCCLLDPRPLPLYPNVSSPSYRPGVLYRQYI